MKKIFKWFSVALVLFLFPLLPGCNSVVTITGIQKTSTVGNVDIYTIYYSDNTTSTFEVNNGQKTIIEIKLTSSVGLIDTYTIYYSDNTTQTFTVSNGRDGENGKDGLVLGVRDIYEEWKKTEGLEDDSFEAFLDYYLTITYSESAVNAVSKAITSVVSINSIFNYSYSSKTGTTKNQKASAGSGVIIKMSEKDKQAGNCYIVTNYHVVYDPSCTDKNHISGDIRVYLYGLENSHNMIKAKFIGGSMEQDIAVLQVTGSDVIKGSIATQCTIAEKEIAIGQDVIAIGNPEGDGISATKGICSVENENINITLSDNITEGTLREIRIDAAVNPGNSGGGLFNMNGELVGIVNAKLIDSKIDCIGYALPIQTVYAVYNRIMETCNGNTVIKPTFAKLGVTCYSYGYQTYFDYDTNSVRSRDYIVITGAIAGGLSATLGDNGFKANDVLVSAMCNEKTYNFDKMYHLSNFLLEMRENTTAVFTVRRAINATSDGEFDPDAEYELVEITLTFTSEYMQ